MTAVCLLVGSAVGALCNPPLLRHPAAAMLATLAAAIFALASDVSPAGAALRHASPGPSPHWPGAADALGAACLLIRHLVSVGAGGDPTRHPVGRRRLGPWSCTRSQRTLISVR